MNASDTSHAPYDELAAGYALAALEPEDEQLFLAHLPGCSLCERAVIEHTDTLGQLAYAAPSAAPPSSVLEGIRAGVQESGRAGAFPAPLPLEVARARRRDRSVRLMTAVIGAAAALVAVLALLVVNRGLSSQEQDAQLAASRLSSTVSSLLVPGARKVDLSGDGGRGAVIINGEQISVVLSGVPANDRRHSTYVLWAKTTFGDVRAVGTFDVAAEQLAVVNDLHLARSSDTITAFLVTRESGRVAPARTTQRPLMTGIA